MSDPGKAIFLSYASQDKEAAGRICDALRAAGLEVWFDISELRGGDAWDAKIRRQIKECALFVPVISANTNARPEGYFRLEWKLAVDRSHLLADDHPFLFPIAIGDVTDATARVPDKFREVQWTRLRLEETPVELAARIAKLLRGEQGAGSKEQRGQRTGDRKTRGDGDRWSWWMVFPILGMITGIMFAVLPLWRSMQGLWRKPAPPAAAAAPAPAASEARALALKAQALFEKVDSTRDDFTAAEALLQRAVTLDPADGLVLAIYSRLNTGFSMRGFDYASARVEEARSQMERAMRLAPEEAEVWLARGSYLRRTNGSQQEAEVALRRALALNPRDTRPWFDLAWAVGAPGAGNDEEVFALLEKSIDPAQPGSDALAHYNQFNLRFGARRFAEADALARASVSELPSANFVAGLARCDITWKGDAKAAVAVMNQLTPERAKEPRSVYTMAYVQLLTRNPTGALQTLNLLPNDFITDSYYTGPRAYWIGRAHQQLGNLEAAKVSWEVALAVSRREGVGRSGRGMIMQAELLALLGREAEALQAVAAYEQAIGSSGSSRRPPWVFSSVRAYAALGRVAEALPLLEAHFAETASVWPLTRALFRLDPMWDKIRDDPRIQALLAKVEAAEIAALPPRDWPKDPELKKAMALAEGLDAVPDDLALAEEIAKRAVDRSPTDIEAVTVMARVQSHFMRRGFDRSDERAALAKRYSERALQLAPDEPEAMYALATYHFTRVTGEAARTEQLLRRAMELDPTNPRPGRLLGDLYNATNRQAEATAQGQENVRRFPSDVLSHYDLARTYKDQGRYEEFDRELDATLALLPLPNAIVWKARLQFGLRNDFAGMKTWLDRVPDRVRGTERAVFGYFLYAAFGGDPEAGLAALRDFPQKWFSDFEYAGPTALLNATLLELQGKKELALRQYEVAEGEIARMRQTDPGRIGLSQVEFWTFLGLGRTEEAKVSYRRLVEGSRRPYAQDMVNGWWFTPIPAGLLIGDRTTALTLLRESVATRPESRAAFRLRFQIDPRLAPFRDDPEINALLAEPEAKP
jgi:tetratricopeptide (TPR) repeat protein